MSTFLQRVYELLEKKGVTKNKALSEMSLNKNSFVMWEKRGTEPSSDSIKKLADYFQVTTDYLLGLTDDFSDAARKDGDDEPIRPFMKKLLTIEGLFRNIAVDTLFSRDNHSLLVSVTSRNTGKELSYKATVPGANDFDEAFEKIGDEIIDFIVTAASTLNKATSDDE